MSLPIDADAHPRDQAYQALTFAHEQQWLVFKHVTPGPLATRDYVIAVPGLPTEPHVERRLRQAAVVAYVTGQADARGVGHLFPPREDQRKP